MYGIAGYEPNATTSVDQLLAAHGERLHVLVGRRLTSATGLCFVEDAEWCSTGVLILDLDGIHLEISVDGFDTVYLSWGTIDLVVPIDTPEQDDPALMLAWGDPHQGELDGVLGGVIRQVWILEHEFRFDHVDGQQFEQWLLAGLELVFDDGRALQLWNQLSELRITADPPDSDSWRRWAAGADPVPRC